MAFQRHALEVEHSNWVTVIQNKSITELTTSYAQAEHLLEKCFFYLLFILETQRRYFDGSEAFYEPLTRILEEL